MYGSLLAAWRQALAADSYELQWSKKSYPFKAVGQVFTTATSATLSLNPGTWYYRVRGINFQLPNDARAMAWSKVQKVIVARPVFTVTSSRLGLTGSSSSASASTPQAGATARCKDGTYSYSKHRQGTCSHHGGVAEWL